MVADLIEMPSRKFIIYIVLTVDLTAVTKMIDDVKLSDQNDIFETWVTKVSKLSKFSDQKWFFAKIKLRRWMIGHTFQVRLKTAYNIKHAQYL